MRIDERIEQRVRDAFGAVANRDGAGMAAAPQGLSNEDVATALSYGLFVVGFILNDVLREGPTDEDYEVIAGRAIDAASGWIDLGDRAAVVALLRAAAKGDPSVPGVSPEDVLGHTFVLGGYLLQAYRLDNQHWWEYLDDIWAQLEATPEPAG
jgi:hypothetical protein